MNWKIWRVAVITSALVACLALAACDDDPITGPGGEVCLPASTPCGPFLTCCTETQCYYEAGGRTFPCDGTECEDAAVEMVAYICDSSVASDGIVSEAIMMSEDLSR